MRWTRASVVLFGASVLSLVEAATAASTLKQVVVISRHGVRGPYGLGTEIPTEETLKNYVRNPNVKLPLSAIEWGTSETEDPNEIVSPKITKHGYQLVKRMGDYFRSHLYKDFLDDSCDKVFAYADNNQRDNLTADAFIRGMYPKCPEVVPMTAQTRLLFEQGQDPTATCPVCSRTVYEGITGANDTRYIVEENKELIAEVNDLLQCCAPAVCDASLSSSAAANTSNAQCSFFDIKPRWNGAFYLPWRDPLSESDYFTEWLMLQSLNNMSIPEELTFEKVIALSKVHETHMDLVTNEVNSANFGATLLAHVTASFQQTVQGKPLPLPSGEGPQLVQSMKNRFLYYAGHDINILYIRNLLRRLQWHTKGWHPHQPTPGGMIIFELHSFQSPDHRRLLQTAEELAMVDEHYVKAFFVTASPQQMRFGEELDDSNPPDRVPLVIPMCSEEVEIGNNKTEVRCPFKTFKNLMGRSLKHECVADTLRPFIDSLNTVAPTNPAPATSTQTQSAGPLTTLLWVAFVFVMCIFVAFLVRHYCRSRRHAKHMQKKEYGTLPQ
ncbi:TPA: hypothetical protein N0F65_009367 [Lagenidium giganteum]|uniref:Acid phosphatase n=1 Tax=Lagenidium giganteum TaxID=4803 RepID=A0AAV2ZDF8_9STRA|nr:TPA: hypothetical protein N0F65_009367 [Lagenidium giganteum]